MVRMGSCIWELEIGDWNGDMVALREGLRCLSEMDDGDGFDFTLCFVLQSAVSLCE